MNEYPKYLYHSKHEPVIVENPDEEERHAKRGYVTHPDKLQLVARGIHDPIIVDK